MFRYSTLLLLLSAVSAGCRSSPYDQVLDAGPGAEVSDPRSLPPWMQEGIPRIQENHDDIFVLFAPFSKDYKRVLRSYGDSFWVIFRSLDEQNLWKRYLAKRYPSPPPSPQPNPSVSLLGAQEIFFRFKFVPERTAYNPHLSFHLLPLALEMPSPQKLACDVHLALLQDLVEASASQEVSHPVAKQGEFCPALWLPVFARHRYKEVWTRP